MSTIRTRRHFLASAAACATAFGPWPALAEAGPPETTTVRLLKESGICDAPLYVAGELLRADGFTEVRYVHIEAGNTDAGMVADQKLDFSQSYAPEAVRQIDLGKPVTVLAGVHPGCHELFAHRPVNSIGDLRGRRVAVPEEIGYANRLMLTVMATGLGLDAVKDIVWVTAPAVDPIEAFAAGDADAFYGGPIEAQRLRERGFDRVILKTATDRPWSQYFCCVIAGNSDYVRGYPVATKRVVRAILKATDICLAEPARAARILVDGGFIDRYDYAVRGMAEVPYGVWREYDPEDTLRWWALRLHEVGLVKSNPQRIIAAGTDWRFLDEIKRELKV
jgi:NitT/TauT family transport system substrate-binding protein